MTAADVHLVWGAATDRGLRRRVNEDAYLADRPLFLVADGMGGHADGALAAHAALRGFDRLTGGQVADPGEVEAALRVAETDVAAIARRDATAAPGTTLAGAVLCEQDGQAYWLVLNIGDSRTYRFADGALSQISVDHSAVQALVERGELDAAAAERHPQRNVVTRAVGAGSSGPADFWLLPVTERERLLVCSDGLTRELDDETVRRALAEEPSAQAAATRLVHEALLHGGRDNVTVVVVDAFAAPGADDDPTAPAGMSVDTLPSLAGERLS